ncbi:hypothetical protein H6P81_012228 [Aristolochia fimbriata]|uniref:Sodium/calcium exchanger membrane region domain-containing protein n=1 Tax=Aristolochia fimbriata TaxID=158543 RepID=A0AAV7EB73_ARIFI|nr:hypothetical protein H6P81_012228 [Aristolochia fimbriata]
MTVKSEKPSCLSKLYYISNTISQGKSNSGNRRTSKPRRIVAYIKHLRRLRLSTSPLDTLWRRSPSEEEIKDYLTKKGWRWHWRETITISVKAEKKRQRERLAEIEKVNKRREERELETASHEEEMAMLARERAKAELFQEYWEKKEEEFHFDQSKIRLRDQRKIRSDEFDIEINEPVFGSGTTAECTKAEHETLLDKDEETGENVENATWITVKAVLMLLLGTAIAAAFADPLVDAVDNFSLATSIPSFFISFIAMPLATNSSEAVSALIFASRKNKKSASLTFSEIYGAVTMNNALCLGVFLALVYIRHLSWDFSAEVLVIFIVSMLMGIFASFRTKFPLWTCSVAYAMYPLSLLLVYVLDYVYGWS